MRKSQPLMALRIIRRLLMRKDRLEWIISGLNQYKLTEREDQFIRLLEQEFGQKNMLLTGGKD
jgi:hypothetical protein